MLSPYDPEPAHPEEWDEFFRLLFRDRDPREREDLVANALSLARKGEIDPHGLFVARGPSGLRGTIACQPVPAATAILFPPRVTPGPEVHLVEDALLRRACDWLRSGGAKLAQAMLAEGEEGAEALVRNGFRQMTALLFLARGLLKPLPEALCRRLRLEPFDPLHPGPFRDTLARTWEGSADCPEIHAVLTVEESLEGHRAQGPGQWWLAREGPNPVGVIVTVRMADAPRWELAYLGVVPEARGRGFGAEMLRAAAAEARLAGAHEMTLCVDERNVPALRLYNRFGFAPFDRREVYFAAWPR